MSTSIAGQSPHGPSASFALASLARLTFDSLTLLSVVLCPVHSPIRSSSSPQPFSLSPSPRLLSLYPSPATLASSSHPPIILLSEALSAVLTPIQSDWELCQATALLGLQNVIAAAVAESIIEPKVRRTVSPHHTLKLVRVRCLFSCFLTSFCPFINKL